MAVQHGAEMSHVSVIIMAENVQLLCMRAFSGVPTRCWQSGRDTDIACIITGNGVQQRARQQAPQQQQVRWTSSLEAHVAAEV